MKVRSKIILYQVGCKKLYVKIVCAVKVVFKNYPIKSRLEKIMDKSYAHHKTCAKKLSSDIYAGKYDLIVIWKKLYIHKL